MRLPYSRYPCPSTGCKGWLRHGTKSSRHARVVYRTIRLANGLADADCRDLKKRRGRGETSYLSSCACISVTMCSGISSTICAINLYRRPDLISNGDSPHSPTLYIPTVWGLTIFSLITIAPTNNPI